MLNSTAQHYLYTVTHLVLSKSTWYWGNFFLVLLLQILSSESPDLAPYLKGAWHVKDHHGQPRAGTTDTALTIHLGCKQPLSLLDKSHTHNQAHNTHQDDSTRHSWLIFKYMSGGFSVCLQVVFGPFDANWRHFDVPLRFFCSGRLPKCLHNGQLLIPANLQFALLWLLDLTPSSGPKQ